MASTESTASFQGLRVASFESRRAAEIERLIEKLGGRPMVSPSMREVPLDSNPAAIDFAHRLISGQVDVVLLLTGVGTRQLVAQVERHIDRERFLHALSDVVTIARGPKPVAALKEFGLEPTHRVPPPNTWHEVLETIDRAAPVNQMVVALQEYGKPNASLVAGLEARGASVLSLKVYNWELPLDTAPLEANLRALVAGEIDVAMFTSAHQVVNVLRTADSLGIGPQVREAFQRVVVASIGPTTSEMLAECELPIDIEPEHSKMGQLVVAAAEQGPALLAEKRAQSSPHPRPLSPTGRGEDKSKPSPLRGEGGDGHRRVAVVGEPGEGSLNADEPWQDSLFMRACRRQPVERTPIWLMRQAGRYMREYRDVREKTNFLDLCKNPALCAEVMLTAVERLNVDAAIIFSDLLPMLEPMGAELTYGVGEGPVIHNPVRSASDVDRIRELEQLDELDFVFETVRLTRAGLPAGLPLIGFAGAPFTLASYLIEGSGSRNYAHTKSLMYGDEAAWHELMGRLSRTVARYLNAQIACGAGAVQIFDSWAGCLGPDDYRRYVLPHTRDVLANITPTAAVINFATGNPALLPLLAESGGDVIGIDWRVRLDDAWRTVGYDRAVQGNLDPTILLTNPDEICRRAQEVLDQAGGRPGHIFNLGHGILPNTPVEHVRALVDFVRESGTRA